MCSMTWIIIQIAKKSIYVFVNQNNCHSLYILPIVQLRGCSKN
jgi:hypothetical protein